MLDTYTSAANKNVKQKYQSCHKSFFPKVFYNCDKSNEAMTLTFFSATNFFWYTVPQWCWGLKELAKDETNKNRRKIVTVDIISFEFF